MQEIILEKIKKNKTTALKTGQYIEAVGRRKTAVARVRIFLANKYSFEINGRDIDDYFKINELRKKKEKVFELVNIPQKFKITIHTSGGGVSAQSDAIVLGIARALIIYDGELRGILKKEGYLKRDARKVERKKPGLKKARKASQWSKR